MEDGRDENGAKAFAECCINILQSGCRYNKGVEKHIKRLLKDREEKICVDVIQTMEKPHRQFYIPKQKKSPPKRKRRWKEQDFNKPDHNRIYYVDRNPYEYNKYRPRHENRKRKSYRPGVDKVGGMEFKRRRTHARSPTFQSKSKRETDGS